MGQGRDAAKNFLRDHPEMMVELRNKIFAQNGIGKLLLDAENTAGEDFEGVEPAVEVEEAPKKSKKAKH
jgi:recombination protein RecA